MRTTVASFAKHLRTRVVLIAALLGALAGFALSYTFAPKYTSESLVLVEEPKVSASIVQPVENQDLTQRVATLQQRALSAENLRPLIESLGLAHGADIDGAIDGIRANVAINSVVTTALGAIPPGGSRQSAFPGFNVAFTASDPHRAQEICASVTNIMIRENLNDSVSNARNTAEFLGRQVEDEKNKLMDLGTKLSTFKKERRGISNASVDAWGKILTTEYDVEQRSYEDLLAKRRSADLMIAMNSEQQGETMSILNPADLPDEPGFPDRTMFAIWGLGGGVVMGIFVIPLFKLRRESRRKEKQRSLPEELPVPTANA